MGIVGVFFADDEVLVSDPSCSKCFLIVLNLSCGPDMIETKPKIYACFTNSLNLLLET